MPPMGSLGAEPRRPRAWCFMGTQWPYTTPTSAARRWVAFEDTWRWYEAIEDFHEVAGDVEGLRRILGEGSNLAYHVLHGALGRGPGGRHGGQQEAAGDKGIDGRGRLPIRKGVFLDVVSQVKGGSTGRRTSRRSTVPGNRRERTWAYSHASRTG